MIAVDAKMLTLDEAAEALGFKHRNRAKTVSRLQDKGLVITDLGYRTKRISTLDLQKFKNEQRAVEKTKRRK